MTHPSYKHTTNSSYVHGLICYGTGSSSELVVYNSSTRRSITLPKIEPESSVIEHFLGYDPIDGVYKVLCMTAPKPKLVFKMAEPDPLPDHVFQVLTLGNGNSWRMVENSHTHSRVKSQICINGVVYYEVYAGTEGKEAAVMGFDVRSENFDVITRPGDALSYLDSYLTMVRYEGKLAIISREISGNDCLDLWVLEDAVKHEWLKKTLVLPSSWTRLAHDTSPSFHRLIDVTDAGELLLAPILMRAPLRVPYYVLYYNPEKNCVRRVEIEGITEHKLLRRKKRQPCFLFHLVSTQVESLMFL